MTIRKAIRLSTLLGCMVASLIYAKAQTAQPNTGGANVPVNAPTAPEPSANQEAKNIRFQFDGIPYMTVIERFAQMVNKPLLLDVSLEGTMKFSDTEPYNYTEALDTLNLVLSMKDAMLVEQDRYLRLLPLSKLRQTPLKVLRNLEERGDVRPGEIVTVALNFKNLDPNEIAQSTTTMLSNAGSVFPAGRGKGIIVTDRIENIERIEKLLMLADVAPPMERQMRTFNILSASGPVLTDLINRTFGIATAPVKSQYNKEKNSYIPLPPSPEDYVTAVWDEASRTMVVFGPTERVDLAEELINRFENKEGLSPTDVRIFYPIEMTPTELSSVIFQTVSGVAGPRENPDTAATKARLVVDEKLGRLIVTTPVAGQMETIEKVIKKVDPTSMGAGGAPASTVSDMKIFYPKHLSPNDLSDMLRQSVSGIAAPSERISNKARLVVDAKQGRLLVITADPEQLALIERVITQLDTEGEKFAAVTLDTKIFYPRRMTPEELSTMLRQMVNGIAASNENDPQKAKLVVDPKFDRLMVISSNTALLKEIEAAIEKVDGFSNADTDSTQTGIPAPASLEKNETSVVRLQYAVALEIGGLIEKTFNDRRFGLRVLVDERSNSLVLNGKAGVLQTVREVIKDLDVQSSSVNSRQIRFLDVRGDPYQLANLTTQVLAEQMRNDTAGSTPQERRRLQQMQRMDVPRIIPEPNTGRLIICGSDEELEKIKAIVEEIDLKSGGSLAVKVFRLRGSYPYELSSVLNRYLNTYREKRKGGPNPSVFVDGHNNSLVVCGTISDIEQASALIEQIDINQDREPRIVKVFSAQYADPYELMNRLKMIYNDQLKSKPEAGAPDAVFIPDYSANSITVAASESHMKLLEELLELLLGESASANGEFRQFLLKGSSPSIVQSALQMIFNRETRSRGMRPWVYPDWNENKIFVYGRPADIAKAEQIIEELDGAATDNPREMKIFNVKTQDIWNFSEQVQQLYRDQMGAAPGKGGGDAKFFPDYSGRLIVSASQNHMQVIEKVIEALNQDIQIESSLRVFKLKRADARNIFPMVQHVALYRGGVRTRGVAPTVNLDVQRNAIVVYGRPTDIAQVEMIINELDSSEMEQAREMKTYRVTSRNVNDQINRVRTFYTDQIKAKPELGIADAIFLPDNEFGRMMVAASRDQLELIDEIVNKLDDKATLPDMQLRLLQPTSANNQEIAAALNFVVRARRMQRPGMAPWISADTRTGGIFVFGMLEDLEYAEQLVKEFDSAGQGLERVVCTYDVQYANMYQFANNVRNLYQDQLKGNSGLGASDAYIFGDDYSGKLIVGVRKDQKEMMDGVVKTLQEKSDAAEPTVRMFTLKSARPSQLVPVLNTVIYSRASRSTVSTRVTADDLNNRIIVSGSAGEAERLGKLIEQLDVPQVRDARILRMFDIDTWDVWGYSERLRELYRDQIKGLADAGPPDAIILPDDFSGRLIVAANEKQMPLIETIMQTLLTELPERQMELRTYKLENIYTSEAMRTINTLMQGASRRGSLWGWSRSSNQDSLTMSPDEKNNSIVVMGSPSKLSMLENILKVVDQKPEKPDREVRFYTLVNADALDVELRLDGLFNAPGRPEEMIFESDFIANTLTVVAREKDFQEIEEMIEKMDNIARDLTEVVRLIPVTNMSAEQMAKVLENIYPQISPSELEIVEKLPPRTAEKTGTSTGYKAPKAAEEEVVKELTQREESEPMKVTLAVDQNANTLIVSGPSFEVDRIRSIVSQLLSSFSQGDSEIRLFRLNEADPVMLARTLNQLFSTAPISVDTESRFGARGQSRNGRQQQPQQGGQQGQPQQPPQQQQGQQGQQQGLPPVPRAIIVPETRTRSVIVRAKPADFVALESLIKQLDAEGIDSLLEYKMVILKNANPTQMLQVVNQVLNQLDVVRPGDPVAVSADERTRSLFLIARDAVMEKLVQIISELDMDTGTAEMEVKVYPLKYVSGTQMGVLLQNLFGVEAGMRRGPGRLGAQTELVQRLSLKDEEGKDITLDLSKPIKIITDPSPAGLNRLIVGVSQSNKVALDEVIRQLDRELPSDMSGVRIIALKNSDANSLSLSLQRLINERVRQRGQADEVRTVILADARSNSLIIGGSNANMALIENLAQELDSRDSALFNNIRQIELKHATAQRLSSTLTALFQRRSSGGGWGGGRGGGVANQAVILPDPRSNSLLVAASDEDNKLLDELLAKLDKPMENPNLEPEVIILEQNDATRLAATIRSVFAARLQAISQPGVQPDPQDRVSVEADTLSNSLIVTANSDNLKTVRDLVKKLDQEPIAEGMVETIVLKYADAQRVSTMLRTLIQQGVYRPGSSVQGRRGGGSQRDAFAITSDIPSNTLIISASPENMALAKELISEIDTEENRNASDIQTYVLKHARAGTLITTLDTFFRNKSNAESRAGIRERAMPITIAADERSNVLLVTGGKEDLDLLGKMLVELDVKDANSRILFNIYPLKNSTASKMQMTLQRLFQNRPAQSRGVPSDPITIVADAWSNALVIGSSPDDESMVQSLITQLDQPETDTVKVQVFPMRNADARRVATTVQALLRGQQGGGGFGAGVGPTVNADERINAIIVSAGENDIKRLQELVEKLDTTQVARVNEIRIFSLTYARATELSSILNSVLNTNPQNLTQTSVARQSLLQFITRTPEGNDVISSALREGILITPDSRSNSLIVSAPVDYMEFLVSLVKSMDQASPQEAKIQIFSLKNADARQMANVLTALFRLQATTGAASQRSVEYTLVKPMSDALSEQMGIEPTGAVGADGKSAIVGSAEQYALTVTIDLRTNTVLVGGTEHYVSLASEIIQTLDSHPAQERKAKVYRLRNSRARDMETALRTFLQQDLNRTISILGQSGAGAAQTILDREVSIVAETVSNSLLISSSPRYFSEVEALIEELDQPLPQVLIQVVLAEVTLDSKTELGVEWKYMDAAGGTPFSLGTDLGVADALEKFGGFSAAVTGSKVNFLMRALQEDGRLEVLSSPQILTADNVEANINIGERVPIVTDTRFSDYGNQTSTYEYENVGVILTVTPSISPDGTVKMTVEPEVSQLTSDTVEVSKDVKIPIISQRTARTTVSVQSGQSVLIGGLISTKDDSRTKKVPWIGNIPLLGALFRNKAYEVDRKELLIVLTPQVIMSSSQTGTNIMDVMDMTRRGFQDSILQTGIKRDPLQEKVLKGILPEGMDTNEDAEGTDKKMKRNTNYTKELLIDP